jgi:hypothetical protein
MIEEVFNKEVFVLLWAVIFATTGGFTREMGPARCGEANRNNRE